VEGTPKVVAQGQGGLLDVRLAPDFASTAIVYLSFTEPREGGKNATAVAKGRLVLEGDGGRLEGVEVIFRQALAAATGFHFGSRIVPAPDGSLFVTTGDRGSLRDEAQNPKSHIGKVLRIMPDGSPAPANPKIDGWAPEVWSIGHRNVQGAALDANGTLFTAEHGARGGDELNRPEKGKNYGWPVITYGRDYSGAKIGVGTEKQGMEQPIYYWDPSIAVSGLAFYGGDLFPQWKGSALIGGLAGAHLSRLVFKDGQVVAEEKLLTGRGDRIRDVREGPDGAVYLLVDERDGKILRLTPAK
jgi:glucose/arabinose dehydrogenase